MVPLTVEAEDVAGPRADGQAENRLLASARVEPAGLESAIEREHPPVGRLTGERQACEGVAVAHRQRDAGADGEGRFQQDEVPIQLDGEVLLALELHLEE